MGTSKNNIHYDAEYMPTLVTMLNEAKDTLDEALGSLKQANRHEGWECDERARINDELGEISKKLEGVKIGLTAEASALPRGAEMFAALENQASANENAVSEEVKKNWFFEALKWVKGAVGSVIGGIGNAIDGIFEKKQAPAIKIPHLDNQPPVTIEPPKSNNTTTLDIKPNSSLAVELPDWLLSKVPSLTDKK
jgi:hypothetical protein